MASVDFGADVSTFAPDLDTTFAPMTGPRVVAEAIVRRLMTPRGALWAHPEYGLDLRMWLNESLDERGISSLRAAIREEVLKDGRVAETTSIAVTLNNATHTMTVRIGFVTAAGPFALVLSISAVSVDLLSVG